MPRLGCSVAPFVYGRNDSHDTGPFQGRDIRIKNKDIA
jgi:hypothetical protein